ncbi:CPBP family intramembrane glutamic endopeptidase [Wenyingzhuangia sp. IMCC45533]
MKPKQQLIVEFLLLFVIYPVFLSLYSIPLSIRLVFIPLILLYLAYISYINRTDLFENTKQQKPKGFWKNTLIWLILIIISSVLFIRYTEPNLLLKPITTQPWVWLKFVFIYTFLSVIPQEFIYRTFYFYRYHSLFKNQTIFLFSNALIFSLAHVLFKSWLIFGITFVGGLLFAYTYKKTKSILWVSVEHAIYGSWLFTVGMGKMFGFPI